MPLCVLLTLLMNEESREGQEVCKAILRWEERKEGLMSLVHHSRGLEPSTADPGWRFRGVHICHMSISYGLISNPTHSKEMLHWGLGMSKGGREWNLLSTFTLYQALDTTRCALCPI